MPRKVITAPAALEDLRSARAWLTQPGSGPTGRARWETLQSARRDLRGWPYAGAQSPDHPNCRYVVSEGYFILYKVQPDTGDTKTAGDVIILAVFPPAVGSRPVR